MTSTRRGRRTKLIVTLSFVLLSGCWAFAGLEDRSLLVDDPLDGGGTDGTQTDGLVGEASVDGSGEDAGDAGRRCRVEDPFETPPRLLLSLSSPEREYSASLSSDELEIFFRSDWDYAADATAPATVSIYRATRAKISDEFGGIQEIALESSKTSSFGSPSYATAGRVLYFVVYPSNLPPGVVYFSTRDDAGAFEEMTETSGLDSTDYVSTIPSGLGVYFAALPPDAGSGLRIFFQGTKKPGQFTRGESEEITGLSSFVDGGFDIAAPTVSDDGQVMYFVISPTNNLKNEIFRAKRAAGPAPGFPVEPGSIAKVTEANIAERSFPVWISPDHCRLYTSNFVTAAKTRDLYVFEKKPR